MTYQTKVVLGLTLLLIASCQMKKSNNDILSEKMKHNSSIEFTKNKAIEIVKTGFNAGDSYGEVWIRDYNTFIELSAAVFEEEVLKENLLVFFKLQNNDGNIVDGFIPREKMSENGYNYIHSELEPRYVGHKNTVETDQESSLVQAVYKYIKASGDKSILDERIGDKTISKRLEWAMQFLMENRYNERYGLLWGATTADWGDVQPEHSWGVYIDENTHRAIDIYDNAMMIIALDNLMELLPDAKTKWQPIRNDIATKARQHLWDEQTHKFIPHIYLEDSPFPDDFNEDEIYYFGGTTVAIQAGLLSKDEIRKSLEQMVERVDKADAASIGLTLYPPYPEGFFKNPIMNPEYSYQNGGDWSWFGGRLIQQLVKHGFLEEAYKQLLPMTERVMKNDGFYEWYSINNEPRGSGTFRGSAGVLYKAIGMLEDSLQHNP